MQLTLPIFKCSTLTYLQDILGGNKKYKYEAEAPTRTTPNVNEFSVKHILDRGYVSREIVTNYFPEDPYKVDKMFFWRMWYSLDQDRTESYVQDVMNVKQRVKKKGPQHNFIEVDDKFLDMLLQYEVKESKYI